MTPERLQEIRARNQRDADWTRAGRDRRELLDYIDLLREQLAQQSRDHTAEVLAWDALAEDTRAKSWDEGYWQGAEDERYETDLPATPNPYRKDQ